MEIKIKAEKAEAFVAAMDKLGSKFNNKYVEGNIEDFVKLDIVDNQLSLTFTNPVPEMVRIACYMSFVETIL